MDITHITEITVSLLTLTFLEIILGVDNLVFITSITARVAQAKQKLARRIGLSLALIMRLLLLLSVLWIIKVTQPVFTLLSHAFSGRDIFLVGGGLFLLYKGTQEIHMEFEEHNNGSIARKKKMMSFASAVFQIAVLDIIFSLDSVITAVGLTQVYWIMATAIFIAIILMMVASEPLSRFVMRYPTIKMLALSFLLLIGMVLVADGFAFHIPREYVYFALSFSIFVESMNVLLQRRRKLWR